MAILHRLYCIPLRANKSLALILSSGKEDFGCCQARRGLPVGFLLLWYSVLFTVESLSLLYLFFIS